MSEFVTIQGKYFILISNKTVHQILSTNEKNVLKKTKKLYFIFLHEYVLVGQCGNQIGSAFWPLALHEYGIQTKTGGVHLLKVQRNHIKHISDLSDAFHSFFQIPDKAKNLHFQNVADLNKSKVKARVCI